MRDRITKRQFIEKLSERNNCGYQEAAHIYEMFFDILTEELLSGSKIIFNGFGSFEIISHKGHIFDSKFHKEYNIIKFSASRVLKSRINSK